MENKNVERMSLIVIFVALPVMVFLGGRYFDNRKAAPTVQTSAPAQPRDRADQVRTAPGYYSVVAVVTIERLVGAGTSEGAARTVTSMDPDTLFHNAALLGEPRVISVKPADPRAEQYQ